jgi:L-aspartate oxidase
MHRTHAEHVYLDMTAKSEEFLKKRFPRIYETCMGYGLDLATDLAPVCPAAHYMMGGVKTDLWGCTSVPGLYSAGETAATGVHGANRLASNSLLEGLVFGARAGQAMVKNAPVAKRSAVTLPGSPAPKPGATTSHGTPTLKPGEKKDASPALTKIRDLMWRNVGILRTGKDLSAAIEQLEALELPKSEKPGRAEYELRNLLSLALLIAKSALARTESRGSHYRSDFPYRDDDDFDKHSRVSQGHDITFEK